MKIEKTALLALGAAMTSGAALASNTVDKATPNVLLILVDDLGLGDLSCQYAKDLSTPNIDRIFETGVRLDNFYANSSVSSPSRAALLTGRFPAMVGVPGVIRPSVDQNWGYFDPSAVTMPEVLKNGGYRTALIGKWHLGLGDETGAQDWNDVVKPNPADIGFDYSYIMAATADRTPCMFMENGKGVGLDPNDPVYVSYEKNFLGEPTGKDNPELLRLHPSHGHDQSIVNGISRIGYMKGGEKARWRDEDIADSIVNHAIRFLERNKDADEPFFLYLATNDIHVPRVPHERFVGKSGLGARGDALLSFDWSVGQVMEALKRLGMDENTIVILSSDNGAVIDDGYKDQAVELLGEHKATGVYRGGKYSIYEGGTRVPCLLRWKGKVAPGVSEQLMSQVDWFASFAEMLGINIPQGGAPDSKNYLDSWMHVDEKGRDFLVEQNLQNNLAITDGEWKYIPAAKGPAMNRQTNTELGNQFPKAQLYHLTNDPGEKNNLVDEHPEQAEKLAIELEKVIESGVYYRK